jgi:3-deoxy-D-manno-oct-2-ulosonic acid (Kdo) hydroxylase
MSAIEVIDLEPEHAPLPIDVRDRAVDALENGKVLFLPRYGFPLADPERVLLSPTVVNKSKNVSYDPRTGVLGGTELSGANASLLRGMIARFADFAQELLLELISSYADGLIRARTSFRPVEVEGRVSSWRKDDSRLHVDSFPSAPTGGKRILRVFANVNPEGRSRVWRVGEPFEQMAARFLPSIGRPLPGSGALFAFLRITKSPRTEYDHLMLHLHDHMKADDRYQKEVEQIEQEFPPGCTWLTFSDQVSHAAMRGQYQFEQTFLLPIAKMRDERRSPLRVLERLTGRKLT